MLLDKKEEGYAALYMDTQSTPHKLSSYPGSRPWYGYRIKSAKRNRQTMSPTTQSRASLSISVFRPVVCGVSGCEPMVQFMHLMMNSQSLRTWAITRFSEICLSFLIVNWNERNILLRKYLKALTVCEMPRRRSIYCLKLRVDWKKLPLPCLRRGRLTLI
jgi:hypothetical protein